MLGLSTIEFRNSNATNEINLIVFPNPMKDKLNLTIPENQIGNRLTIYSVLGQSLNSYILKNKQTILDVSAYQNGIYLLKIAGSSGAKVYTVVKE